MSGDAKRFTRRGLLAGAAGLGGLSLLGHPRELAAREPAGHGTAKPAAGDAADRLERAYEVRVQAAKLARSGGIPHHRSNGDEERLPGIACYSKGLPHNPHGEADPRAYEVLLGALRTGKPEDFERIPLGGFVKLANPQAALAFDLLGPDACQPVCQPAPAFASSEQGGELIELYWKALARDVPFAEYGENPLLQEATGELSKLPEFRVRKRVGRSRRGRSSGAPPPATSPAPTSHNFSGNRSPGCRSRSSRKFARPLPASSI